MFQRGNLTWDLLEMPMCGRNTSYVRNALVQNACSSESCLICKIYKNLHLQLGINTVFSLETNNTSETKTTTGININMSD